MNSRKQATSLSTVATFYIDEICVSYRSTEKCTILKLPQMMLPAQDVLLYYGASGYGSKPEALGQRSPRESYNIEAESFLRERGSYQNPPEHP